jgi:hypothetical protein
MTSRRRSVRPCLESLECRAVPANLTVTFAGGTLTVVGDAATGDNVTVEADRASLTHFTLTSTADTFNNQPSPFSTPAGVKSFVFKMGSGADSIDFDNASGPIAVQGNVTINGGDGNNSVASTDLTVDKNLSITNGTATTGDVSVIRMTNVSVGGNVTMKSTGGSTSTSIGRNSVGVSTIKGNVTVTNGTGEDAFTMTDTNVDKNVTINNGHGSSGGIAGYIDIYNLSNTAVRSVIGGNLTDTYLDGSGDGYDGLWDLEVQGNVTLNHGPGAFATFMDGFLTRLPVQIHGNLSILGTGANTVDIGKNDLFGNGSGLTIGKKFTVTSSGGTAETMSFFNLHVGGNTSFTLGNGGNTVTIDDSEFDGTFTLLSGAGADTVDLETTAGTSAATEFRKAVKVNLGGGGDTINFVATSLASTPDAGQALVFWGAVSFGQWSGTVELADVFFPNGGRFPL